MASALPVVWVLIGVIVLTVILTMSLRGDDLPLKRTIVVTTMTCLYLMWAITFLAQANPLIVPIRTGWADHGSEH